MKKPDLKELEKAYRTADSYLTGLAERLEKVPYRKVNSQEGFEYSSKGVYSQEVHYGLELELKYKSWSSRTKLKEELMQVSMHPELKTRLEEILKGKRLEKQKEFEKDIAELSVKIQNEMEAKQKEEQKNHPGVYPPCPYHPPIRK